MNTGRSCWKKKSYHLYHRQAPFWWHDLKRLRDWMFFWNNFMLRQEYRRHCNVLGGGGVMGTDTDLKWYYSSQVITEGG